LPWGPVTRSPHERAAEAHRAVATSVTVRSHHLLAKETTSCCSTAEPTTLEWGLSSAASVALVVPAPASGCQTRTRGQRWMPAWPCFPCRMLSPVVMRTEWAIMSLAVSRSIDLQEGLYMTWD
jgi:hypothetical protein